MNRLYASLAVLLPITLGFGLIYLSVMGRIEPLAAILTMLCLAVVLPLAAYVASLAREAERERDYPTRQLAGD